MHLCSLTSTFVAHCNHKYSLSVAAQITIDANLVGNPVVGSPEDRLTWLEIKWLEIQ